MYYDQAGSDIRSEWGLAGVELFAPSSDAIIIIDVFSFTTCVDVAVSRGARVYPYPWKDERAVEYARSVGARLATGSRHDPSALSLSPVSMMRLEAGEMIVLPSPNGATLSLATGSTPTFAGCLRNARAVARAAQEVGQRVSVIPAGERWEDGRLRPALEDLLAAGAIIHHLAGSHSPEAEAALAVFLRFQGRLEAALAECGSGKEAADRGSKDDVRLAAALNASSHAPRLVEGAYQLT